MKKNEKKAYFWVIGQLLRSIPHVVIEAVLDGAIIGARPFIAVYLTGLLVDAVYQGAPVEQMVQYALIGVGSVLVMSVLEGFILKNLNRNMEYMYERQIGPLSKKSMQMDYEYLENNKIHNIREAVGSFFPRFGVIGLTVDSILHFSDIVVSIVAAVIIVIPKLIEGVSKPEGFKGSGWFSLIFLFVIVFMSYINTKLLNHFNDKKEKIYNEKQAPLDTRRKFYVNLFSKADTQKDIRMCNQTKLVREEAKEISSEIVKVRKEANKVIITKSFLFDTLSALSTVLVYAFTGIYGFLGIITIGSVVSFAASIQRVTDYLFYLSEILGEINWIGSFAAQYKEFMELNQRRHEGTIPMEKRQDNKFLVEFDHVSFRYPGSDIDVIKDLNMSFVIGEKMAIVGKNGSGKTTFIKLLCRLYDVTEGCIKVNGIDIRKYSYQEYCELFGVVFQDFTIFDFGLGESIACSENFDSDRTMDALERAGMKERVDKLENGLNTLIGKSYDESGVNFSGGEKQKLAIARAIYKDAPFVIMDEPTAALDPEAECEVFAGFDKMVGNKTAIYISHRLASCRFCENILVFDKGKVVQRGSHSELEKQDGLYQNLWQAQAQYYM